MEEKVSILIVDDNESNTLVLSSVLKEMGFNADEAYSGVEAIEKSCHKMYDLVFVDHLMPDMDGIETIKKLKFIAKGKENIVFVGVTATLDEEVINLFSQEGVNIFLEKPVKISELKKVLNDMGYLYEKTQDTDEINDIEVFDILSKITGLNYKKGIEIMSGNTKNYMKVLKVCVKNIRDNCENLVAIKETSNLESFDMAFHSLKGIFLNVGADFLAEVSKSYEMAAKSGNIELIKKGIDAYLNQVNDFNEMLQDAYSEYEKYQSDKNISEGITNSEFKEKLEILKQHIEDFEYIEITELLDELIQSSEGQRREGLQSILNAIEQFDYDDALFCLDQLMYSE